MPERELSVEKGKKKKDLCEWNLSFPSPRFYVIFNQFLRNGLFTGIEKPKKGQYAHKKPVQSS